MIIYKITNKINGKIYVGQTRQKLSVRWRQHGYGRSNTVGLKGAILKYGKDNFLVECVFTTDDALELNAKEQEFIKQSNSLVPNGYNLTTGGEGGYTRSEETRKRLSLAGKGKSRPHTDESKRRLSEAHTGSKNPMFGKPLSPEHRSKISNSLKGKKRPDEVRKKISEGHKRRLELIPNAPGSPQAA